MPTPYCTEGDVEKFLLTDIDPSFSAQITAWIAMAQEWIDAYCNTTFSSTSGDHYYDGTGTDSLFVEEFEGNPSVYFLDSQGNVVQTLVLNQDFYCYPLNETTKNHISLTRRSGGLESDSQLLDDDLGSTVTRVFPRGHKTVKVTASFGRSVIPASVTQAATIIVAGLVDQGLRGGDVSSEKLGSYAITYNTVNEMAAGKGIKSLLAPYRSLIV